MNLQLGSLSAVQTSSEGAVTRIRNKNQSTVLGEKEDEREKRWYVHSSVGASSEGSSGGRGNRSVSSGDGAGRGGRERSVTS